MKKTKILFLCTGNSIRSQITEAWARHLKSDEIDAYSAGIIPCGVNAYAVEAMAEVGIDISQNKSKHVASLQTIPFDYVITVCSYADERCPIFPGETRIIHIPFDDPMMFTEDGDSHEEILSHFRRTREEIKVFV
ncbi:arsenate reductase ArsC, partial [bacterium]|nr:arsenate reductase ArsC [bacterium]